MKKPKQIKRLSERELEITWMDGAVNVLDSKTLRANCPAADSRMKRGDLTHARPLTSKPSLLKVVDSSLEEEIKLSQIWGIGNYAIGIRWGDGHDTGIYSFDFLYELANKI